MAQARQALPRSPGGNREPGVAAVPATPSSNQRSPPATAPSLRDSTLKPRQWTRQLFRKTPRRPIPTEPSEPRSTSSGSMNPSPSSIRALVLLSMVHSRQRALSAAGATPHPCAVNNDGDRSRNTTRQQPLDPHPVLRHQTAVHQDYWQCIAISKTSDATGAYNVYAYKQPTSRLPKFGVWNGTYYATYNMSAATPSPGARLCAYDGASMRTGALPQKSASALQLLRGVLPADVDGAAAPPKRSNEYFLSFGSTALHLALPRRLHLEFELLAYRPLHYFGRTLQRGLRRRHLRPSARNNPAARFPRRPPHVSPLLPFFSDGHEALFVNHSVNTGSVVAGVRWYELRPAASGGVTVFQQSTYAPGGALNRWMGSIASTRTGNLAVGYSTSSASSYPAIQVLLPHTHRHHQHPRLRAAYFRRLWFAVA